MGLRKNVSCQFGKPKGVLGHLAGFIMANRKSNIERIDWAIELLDLKPDENILEIGFGPGIALQKIAGKISDGEIYGIDHSRLMLAQAMKRNKTYINSGKLNLFLGSTSNLPVFDIKFDKVLDVNSFQFWDDPVLSLNNLKKYIKTGGIIEIVHQPREPKATDKDAFNIGNKFAGLLHDAGYKDIKIEKKIMKPVSTVCVFGTNK